MPSFLEFLRDFTGYVHFLVSQARPVDPNKIQGPSFFQFLQDLSRYVSLSVKNPIVDDTVTSIVRTVDYSLMSANEIKAKMIQVLDILFGGYKVRYDDKEFDMKIEHHVPLVKYGNITMQQAINTLSQDILLSVAPKIR